MTPARTLAGVAAAVTLLIACRPAAPPVTAAHVTWASAQWPTTTQADLEHGRVLFVRKCSGCHRPPAPTGRTPSEWPGDIEEMRERAHLSSDEVRMIERYVVTLASRP